MISRPTTPQLIEAVCAELRTKVAPTLTDGSAQVVLDMALQLLAATANRSANELAWMREEADAIEVVAGQLVAELPGAVELSTALRLYVEAKTDSRYLAAAEADYDRVSEVLSCAAEAVFVDGDPARKAAVMRLFEQRMANENAVTGEYVGAGRG